MRNSTLFFSAGLSFILLCGSPVLHPPSVSGNQLFQSSTPQAPPQSSGNPFEDIAETQSRNYSRILFGRTGEELAAEGPLRMIDVDLGEQVIYAYEDNNMVRRFVASTGTQNAPTIIGQFRAYEFYDSTYMVGEGFFYPRVRYVIYFYKGYSFHAADWHDNFGEPMSHGCINLREEDARWLFNWAGIGTLVNIHY
jgi:lipoprotein-anchoring transpeptidase ErfK/SrfK